MNNSDALQTNREDSENWYLDERIKRLLLDLQRHWLVDYQNSREKSLVELTAKMHQEFLAEQQRTKNELLAQFKEELENTRIQLENKHQEAMDVELQRVTERFQREIQACKKKQWCTQCENEAIYHCCWNTAYCSTDCQQRHWPNHRRNCRRKQKNP
ncbi:MYND finger [Aphelenchoides bicaudatus]|nr:MYND finger [Aphelenchoides bicaudatus]